MQFLEMVKACRLLSGMQGSGPSSVVGAQGIEEVLVRATNDAYRDIQNHREDYPWLLNKVTFNTVVGQDEYTPDEALSLSDPTLKSHKTDSFIIEVNPNDKRKLILVDYDTLEERYLNDTSEGAPIYVAINPSDEAIYLKPTPDQAYPITFKYYQIPEELTTDSQTPKLPPSFHTLIIYKALEKMAIYLNNPQVFSEYATETARLLGSLMRDGLPKKRMKRRPLV